MCCCTGAIGVMAAVPTGLTVLSHNLLSTFLPSIKAASFSIFTPFAFYTIKASKRCNPYTRLSWYNKVTTFMFFGN
jgi:hypothetical protein